MNIDHSSMSFDELMKVLAKRVAMEFNKNYYAKLLDAIEKEKTKLDSDLVDICRKRHMLDAMYATYMRKYLACNGKSLSYEDYLKCLSKLDKMRQTSFYIV